MGTGEAQFRWRHEMRGEDPNDPDLVLGDAIDQLRKTFEMVRELLEQRGISPDDTDEPLPSLTEARMQKLAVAYAASLRDLECADHSSSEFQDPRQAAATVGSKLARLASLLESPDELDVWAWDAVPNLLLIAKLDRDVASAVDRACGTSNFDPGPFRQARAELRRIVEPLVEAIAAEAREALDQLVAAKRAPSPFYRVALASGAGRMGKDLVKMTSSDPS